MRAAIVLAGLTLAAFAGCGEDDEPAPSEPAEQAEGRLADVQITYDRDGKGGRPPLDIRLQCDAPGDAPACRALAQLDPEDFEPVPDDTVCTSQYGGPETASVQGTLRGKPVDATFSREQGCEINRWERVAPLFEGTP